LRYKNANPLPRSILSTSNFCLVQKVEGAWPIRLDVEAECFTSAGNWAGNMWKFFSAAIAVLAIASTSFLYAERADIVYVQRPTSADEEQLWQSGPEDLHGFSEARLAALKSALILTSDQARDWAVFEKAARDFHRLRMDRRMAARTLLPSDNPVERLQQRATAMTEAAEALNKLAESMKPLYSSLDENQKRRFAVLNHLSGLDQNRYRDKKDEAL
jgi:hypothetical protein